MPRSRLRKLPLNRHTRIKPEIVAITDAIAHARACKARAYLDVHDKLPAIIREALTRSDVPFEANHMLGLLKNGTAPERIIKAIEMEGKKMPPQRVRPRRL